VSIGALLFDLGGVVIDVDFGRVVARWAALAGGSVEAIAPRFSADLAYERHERGEINAAGYFTSLRASLGIELTDAEFVDGWNQIYVGEVPGVRALLESLAPRVPLYAFTNSNRTHQPVTLQRYADVLKPFRQVFFSCDMGLRKPEPAAFEAIAAAIAVPLDRILFFDDSAVNVGAARAIGMPAVLVRSLDDIAAAVAAL
jgi:glucose-1-phosphatase